MEEGAPQGMGPQRKVVSMRHTVARKEGMRRIEALSLLSCLPISFWYRQLEARGQGQLTEGVQWSASGDIEQIREEQIMKAPRSSRGGEEANRD